jgi:hypothetical protein
MLKAFLISTICSTSTQFILIWPQQNKEKSTNYYTRHCSLLRHFLHIQ